MEKFNNLSDISGNLIHIEEWVGDAYCFIGVFSDIKIFISKFIKQTESRKGENNKYIRHKINGDELLIQMNYGMSKFLIKNIYINEIY